jgi:hypothetical protein
MTLEPDLRCSAWARAERVDPIGTAGSYAGFLLVEWPLPWPRDVADIPALAPLTAATRRVKIRLQAVVPQRGRDLNVSIWRWAAEQGRFLGQEAPAGPDPAATASALLVGERVAGLRPIDAAEVLVCGHGRRDRCCGSLGTSLEVELRSAADLETSGVRLRRTSHTGGHRFAPTAILFPEGTVWGYLDAESLTGIVTRRTPIADVAQLYRGCCGLPSPAVQALEREVLGVVGWPLYDRVRRGSDLAGGPVSLDVEGPDGRSRRWTGRVVTKRVLPVPKCGEAVTGEEKTELELAVEDFEEVFRPAERAG